MLNPLKFQAKIATLFLVAALAIAVPSSAVGEPTVTQVGQSLFGEVAGDQFGQAVAISADGSRLAVSSLIHSVGPDSNVGQVKIFAFDSQRDTWTQLGQTLYGDNLNDQFGISISLNSDGSRLAVGANQAFILDPLTYVGPGYTRVFEFDVGTSRWVQLGSDISGDSGQLDYSGYSVSLNSSGNLLAVGAPQPLSGEEGRVRLYELSGGSWTQKGGDIDGEASRDQFGIEVALSADGTTVAIGGNQNSVGGIRNAAGHVRVHRFTSSTNTWEQLGSDIDGEAVSDQIGDALALSADGNRLASGTPYSDAGGAKSNAGEVKVFDWTGSVWTQAGSTIYGDQAGDRLGYSVSLSASGHELAVGVPAATVDGNSAAGEVRVFTWNSTDWSTLIEPISSESSGDLAGWSLAMNSAGSYLAIGSIGNQAGGIGANTGRAQVFSISADLPTSSPVRANVHSAPGIFLSIRSSAGNMAQSPEAHFGSYAVQPDSPYLLSIRETGNLATTQVLTSGATNEGGHLDETLTLPALGPGSHTLVFSATGATGHRLILGNTIIVDSTGTITSVTPENLQPTIR